MPLDIKVIVWSIAIDFVHSKHKLRPMFGCAIHYNYVILTQLTENNGKFCPSPTKGDNIQTSCMPDLRVQITEPHHCLADPRQSPRRGTCAFQLKLHALLFLVSVSLSA